MFQQEPAIEILLATYNGERYLREQIDSLLAQTYPFLRVIARDDGSSDSTIHLLQEYAMRDPDRFRLLAERERTGSAQQNILRLLRASTAPYVCFCDQDDVWLPDKVAASMKAMRELERQHGEDTPLLVFGDLTVVSDSLTILYPSLWRLEGFDPRNSRRLRALLGQNVATGCTMLLNQALATLALRMPREAPMHDRWVALLACSMGTVSFVTRPLVLYRQHDGNVIGASEERSSAWEASGWKSNAEKRVEQWFTTQRMAAALLHVHGAELPPQNVRLLQRFLLSGRSPHRLVRVWLLLRHRFFRAGMRRKLSTLWDVWRTRVPQEL